MKVMVTGGAGFIGSHVADALVRAGDRVIVVDDLSTGFRANLNPGAEFIECDIRDPRAADLVREERPDAICHHAAQMSVPRSLKEPMLDVDVNVRASLQLALAAAETGARFLFASTGGALYGDADVLPTPESYPAWPVSPYGAGKLAFEHYLHALRLSLGLDYVVLRYGNVFGPRQNPHGEAGVVAIFCRALVSGSYCAITGDGRQTRDYIYVDDVVAACLAALRGAPSGSHYNVGTGRQTSVNEIFELIVDALGSTAKPVHVAARPGEQKTSALDSRRISTELGWRPRASLRDGLLATAQWFRAEAGQEAHLTPA